MTAQNEIKVSRVKALHKLRICFEVSYMRLDGSAGHISGLDRLEIERWLGSAVSTGEIDHQIAKEIHRQVWAILNKAS